MERRHLNNPYTSPSLGDFILRNCYNRGNLTAVFNTGDPLLVQIGGIASTPPSNGQVKNVYNTGSMGECVWVEDTEGVNGGYPIPITM
ncbi:MAG: hypothetical protein IJK92_04425 [Bacteroidales bacterium]|nr:hypothetical protein [Bacteroidales bacterium]